METAATLREHLRIPGMGLTTMRYFRDKLAMRMRALDRNVRVPDFVSAGESSRHSLLHGSRFRSLGSQAATGSFRHRYQENSCS